MTAITIAVPVFNGETMIRQSLECLRQQTFKDFEVLVFDNASTDTTRDIVNEFVAADPRFKLIVQPHNKGALANFVDGLHAATAPHFLWRAFDDVTDDVFLAELDAALSSTPGAHLANGRVRTLRLDGTKERFFAPPRLTGIEIIDVLILMFTSHAGWFYGLWDRTALTAVFDDVMRRFPHPWASDHLILFPLLLDRSLVFTDKTTFSKYIKRTSAEPRDKSRPPVKEMTAMRRDFSAFCKDAIARQFPHRPLARAVLRAALLIYVDKRVYRMQSVARIAVTEALTGARSTPQS